MSYAAPFHRHQMLSSSKSASAQGNSCMELPRMSYGKNSKKQALDYRAFFTARWSQFVRENFDSPEHAAVVFGVDVSTARKWWGAEHAPSGFAVGMAYQHFPSEAAATLQSEA